MTWPFPAYSLWLSEWPQPENILNIYYRIVFKSNNETQEIHSTKKEFQRKPTPQWKSIMSNFYSIYPTVVVWLSWLPLLHLPGVSFPVLWISWLSPCSLNWLHCPSWDVKNSLYAADLLLNRSAALNEKENHQGSKKILESHWTSLVSLQIKWSFSPVTWPGDAVVKHLHSNTKRKCHDVIELKLSIQNQTKVCIDLPSCSGRFCLTYSKKCAKCLETGLEVTTV